MDIDIAGLNGGLSLAGHVGARVYLGGGFSIGPALSVNRFSRYPRENAEAHAFARWAPASTFQMDAGVRIAFIEDFDICFLGPCTKTYDALVGPYFDVHAGWRRFKLGPRLAYMSRTERSESSLMFYPLVLRVQFTP